MKKLAVLIAAALVSASAFAAAWKVGNSYVLIGGEDNGTWYQASGQADWATGGAFNGKDLGEFSDSILIGGQVAIYADDAAQWTGYTDSIFGWKVTQGSGEEKTDKVTGNPFVMSYLDNGSDGDGNYLRAQSALGEVIDISALDAGSYNLEVWFGPVDNNYDSNNSANYVATFTKSGTSVPEPATMSLLGLGALAMVLRRKLRK